MRRSKLRVAAAPSGHRLLAVDEFELDDPRDTVLVSTVLSRLAEGGVTLAATSKYPAGDLGDGRFAAADFRREVQGLAGRFEVIRVDGPDYRERGAGVNAAAPAVDIELMSRVQATPGATVDDFAALCGHLAELHPSRYRRLIEGVPLVGLRGVRPLTCQSVALRLVVLVDRRYDRQVAVSFTGTPLSEFFPPDLLSGPHRKKYQRALSRLGALSRFGEGS